jgi:hypothetical protein
MGKRMSWLAVAAAASIIMLFVVLNYIALFSVFKSSTSDVEQVENLAALWGPPKLHKTQPVAAKTDDTDREEGRDIAAIRVPKGNVGMQRKRQKVNLLKFPHIDLQDMFAATWLQPLSKFMTMDVNEILTVEDGCFVALRGGKQKYVRMTVDWLDFSVEHLSKWWKLLNALEAENDPIPYNTILSKLQGLLEHFRVPVDKEMPMGATLAVISFQPYKSSKKPEWGRTLTVTSLAGTIASLIQAGFGRVVVVGHNQVDSELSQQAFQLILRNGTRGRAGIGNESAVQRSILRIGHTEVGFVRAVTNVTTRYIKVNMPKAAIEGLQQAFKGDLGFEETKLWLGNHHNRESSSPWKYVYLTEPDTILQTRPWVLPQLVDALDDEGCFILVPHRLQPIPHESDVKGYDDKTTFVPAVGDLSVVMELDALGGDVCCDAGIDKPGESNYPECGTFWYMCGFGKKGGDPLVDHERLLPYKFMRLRDGTGIVSLTGTEHGRRCNQERMLFANLLGGTWTPASGSEGFMDDLIPPGLYKM